MILIISVRNTTYTYVTLEHKTSLKSLGYICSNSQNIIDFSFIPKIMFHEEIL